MNKNTHGHVMPEHRRQRWALRKLSVGMCSVLLGFAVMIPTVPAVGAAEIFAVSDVGTANAGVKELDTSSHFTATGVLDSSLRYASTVYKQSRCYRKNYADHDKMGRWFYWLGNQ